MEEKKRGGWLIRMAVRAVLGMAAIYIINQYLASQDISVSVGMNGLSLLTSAVLGIPGVALLYGILFYQNL